MSVVATSARGAHLAERPVNITLRDLGFLSPDEAPTLRWACKDPFCWPMA